MDNRPDIVAKAAWRILPILMLCYFAAFLDRVNIGFAALTMNQDLGFSASVFGFGAGIFFLGYILWSVWLIAFAVVILVHERRRATSPSSSTPAAVTS